MAAASAGSHRGGFVRGKRVWAGMVVGLLFAACGDDEGSVENLGEGGGQVTSSTAASGAGGCRVEDGVDEKGEEVFAVLSEFAISPEEAETPVPAGIVSFLVENDGEEPHELVIVEADDAGSLPVDGDGALDEAELEAGALIGEIEPFDGGELCKGNFEVGEGNYVLLCNIVEEEDGDVEAHFKLGMFTTFEVGPAAGGEAAGGYEAGSDVAAHAAIGGDIAALRTALDPATKGKRVDWASVEEIFEEGGASEKSDGSKRTLAGLVAESDTVTFVRDAIARAGTSKGATDPVRRQRVDKGVSVLLAEKMGEELDAARTKIEAENLDADEGAPHNVDEAWAFFTAAGHGLAATAEKRAADFERDGKVKEPILDALTAAQAAARKGDLAAFDTAVSDVADGTAYIFYLATYKYLGGKDDVERTEGASFYRGIGPRVRVKDTAAHEAIIDAFASGDTDTGRAALNSDAVLSALGVNDAEKVE
jgi:hypothetical protein